MLKHPVGAERDGAESQMALKTAGASPDRSRCILVMVGPTASGKTVASLHIAHRLDAEIISADSRQIYRYMEIGTAKPAKDERKTIKHYFVDELKPDQDFNAGDYGTRGREIIDGIFRRHKVPFVVGGSGLYVQALVDGFFEGPSADPGFREHLEGRLKTEGAGKLLDELRRIDPVAASRMLPSTTRRIVRALEVHKLSGMPISELHKSRHTINFRSIFVGLQWDRKVLYDRINQRVDRMIEQGLMEEVKKLSSRGYSRDLNALQTTGYQEAFEFLEGKISHDRMVELIKRNTRRYAKRQLTWFRRDKRIRWFDVKGQGELATVASNICDYFLSEVGAESTI